MSYTRKGLRHAGDMVSRQLVCSRPHPVAHFLLDVMGLSYREVSTLSQRYAPQQISSVLLKGKFSRPAYANFTTIIDKIISELQIKRSLTPNQERLRRVYLAIARDVRDQLKDDHRDYSTEYIPLTDKAARLLRAELTSKITLNTSELHGLARSSGFSMATLHAAANKIGVIKKVRSRGRHKGTYTTWRLSDES